MGVDFATEICRRRRSGFAERDGPRARAAEFGAELSVDLEEVIGDGGVQNGALNVRLFAE